MKGMSADLTIVASIMSVTSLHSTPCTSTFYRFRGCLEPAQGSLARCYLSLREKVRLLPRDLCELALTLSQESALHAFHWQNLKFDCKPCLCIISLWTDNTIMTIMKIFCSWMVLFSSNLSLRSTEKWLLIPLNIAFVTITLLFCINCYVPTFI